MHPATSNNAVWFPKCYRLHHPVWGWARVREGVRPSELPGGSGAGVDHSGPGKVTCFEERGDTKGTIVLFCGISQWTLCVSTTLSALLTLARTLRRLFFLRKRNVFIRDLWKWGNTYNMCVLYKKRHALIPREGVKKYKGALFSHLRLWFGFSGPFFFPRSHQVWNWNFLFTFGWTSTLRSHKCLCCVTFCQKKFLEQVFMSFFYLAKQFIPNLFVSERFSLPRTKRRVFFHYQCSDLNLCLDGVEHQKIGFKGIISVPKRIQFKSSIKDCYQVMPRTAV